MMTTKLEIYISLICFIGNIKDSWQQDSCPSNETYLLGVDQQRIDYVGNGSCVWRVPESVFKDHAVLLVLDNTTMTASDKSCMGQLVLPGDEKNGTCQNMVRACFAYYNGDTCNRSELSKRIAKEKFDCNNVSLHIVINDFQFQYQLINTSINHEFPSFQILYKPIKCSIDTADVRNEVTTSFGRSFKNPRGNSGKNNEEGETLSTEKTAITIVAATIGSITVLLIVLTIIKREKAHRRNASSMELNNTTKDSNDKEDELFSPNNTYRNSEETQAIENQKENVTHASYYHA